ncbi:Lipid A core - O-antigen ligase and related enzymes [Listeria grayi]|nr:O-antigen ligase family protein [Listeria grayi]VEI36666.1 Lipid A core - O-antigen ligase and related enzymes [Listeria grayi]
MNTTRSILYKKWLYYLVVITIGLLGTVNMFFYALVPIWFVLLIVFQLKLSELQNYLWWIIVISIFFGAYLSIPGHESFYLFRFVLPVYLVIFFMNNKTDIKRFWTYSYYLFLLSGYLLASICSVFLADSKVLGVRYCYFIFEIVCMFFICFYNLKSKKTIYQFARLATYIFVLNIVIGLIEVKTGMHMKLSAAKVYVTTTIANQPTGFLYNPNDFALFLNILYPIVILNLYKLKKRWFVISYLVLTSATAYVIISTYSRIGMLCFAISVLVTSSYIFREKLIYFSVTLFPICLFSAMYSPLGKHLTDIVYSSFTDKDTSTSARENLYKLLWKICKDSHFLGVGAGNVPPKLNALILGYTSDSDAYTTGHNFWLETLANIGIVGFVFFIGILALLLYQIIKRISTNPPIYGIVALLIWLSFVGSTIALSTILEKRFLWFVLAVSITMIQMDVFSKEEKNIARRR